MPDSPSGPPVLRPAGYALRALGLAVLVLAVMACTDGLPPEFPLPEFSLKSPLTGAVVDNSTLAGRPALLYWFTSW